MTAGFGSPAGFLVLHPDLLLSGTRISGSTRCPRQSILEERFGGSSSNKAVEGTLLHELFQVRPANVLCGAKRARGAAAAVASLLQAACNFCGSLHLLGLQCCL